MATMTLFCPGINQKYADNGRARPVGNNNPKTSLGRNCSCYSPPRGWPFDAQLSYEKIGGIFIGSGDC